MEALCTLMLAYENKFTIRLHTELDVHFLAITSSSSLSCLVFTLRLGLS